MRPYAVFLSLIATAPLFAESAPAPTLAKQPAVSAQEIADKRWARQAAAAIVANVDGRAVTTADIWNEVMPSLSAIHQKASTEDEFGRLVNQRREEVRDQLTDKYLILSETKEKGIQLPASVIQEQIDERIIREFNGDRNEYLRSLRLQGRTPLDDRKAMEEDILVDVAARQFNKTTAEVSPEKIQRYYEANKDVFAQPAGVKLSQIILWPGAAESDADVRKLAEEVVVRLDKGESFADIAKKYSKDDTREQGGETPWHNVSELNAEVAKHIAGLKDGQHTKPIEFMVGGRLNVYIYRLDASRAEGALPMEEVREKIEGILLGSLKKASREEWMARLRQHYFVRYYN